MGVPFERWKNGWAPPPFFDGGVDRWVSSQDAFATENAPPPSAMAGDGNIREGRY